MSRSSADCPQKTAKRSRKSMAFLGGVFQHFKMPFGSSASAAPVPVQPETSVEEAIESTENKDSLIDLGDGLMETKLPQIEIAIEAAPEANLYSPPQQDDVFEPLQQKSDVSGSTDLFVDAPSDIELHLPTTNESANTTATEYFNADQNLSLDEEGKTPEAVIDLLKTPVHADHFLNTSAELVDSLIDQVERNLNFDETAILLTPVAPTPISAVAPLCLESEQVAENQENDLPDQLPLDQLDFDQKTLDTSSPTKQFDELIQVEQNDMSATRNVSAKQEVNTNTFTKSQIRQAKPMVQQKLRLSGNQTAIVAPLMASGDDNIANNTPTEQPKKAVNHGRGEPVEEFSMASSELLNDPHALDYLQKAGGEYTESEQYRESLYVNFDPLVAKSTSKPTVAGDDMNSEFIQSERAIDDGENLLLMKTPSPRRPPDPVAPSTVVVKKPQKPQATEMTDVDVDKLLKNFPEVDKTTSGDTDVDRIFDDETLKSLQATAGNPSMDEVVVRLRLQFQAVLLAKEREWSSKLQKEQLRADKLSNELKTYKRDCEQAKQAASEMTVVVVEYEKTMRQLMGEVDGLKKNRVENVDQIIRDRDQAIEDLQSVENSFADLHRRYDKLRLGTEDFKNNEEKLKQSLCDHQSRLKREENKFHRLREHAEDKLEKANQEIERLNRSKETDTLALRAQLKKRELQVETLEKSLETKQREIHELTAICDELIQKAGGGMSNSVGNEF